MSHSAAVAIHEKNNDCLSTRSTALSSGRGEGGITKGRMKVFLSLACFFVLGSAIAAEAMSEKLATPTSFNIPAQPLSTALKTLADQAGIQILFEEQVVRGHDAPAIKARQSVAQVLAALLANTDLEFTAKDDTVAVRRRTLPRSSSSSAPVMGTATVPENESARLRLAQAEAEEDSQGMKKAGEQTSSGKQTAPSHMGVEASGIQEIVVTAQKRAESVQEVPIAITALSGRDLATRGVKNMSDLASQVPGVAFGDVGAAPQIFARGVGYNTLTGSGEGAVAVHIDGVYLQHPGSVGMLQRDLERVEFLRGPQGTLYGRNAVGGVINLVTAAPANEFGGSASASYGNYDAYEVSGYVTGPITDTVRARLYLERDDRDGYVKNLSPELSGQSRYDGFGGNTQRLSIDVDLTPETSLKLRLFNRREDFSGPLFKPINPEFASAFFGLPRDVLESTILSFDPYKTRLDAPADAERKFWGGSARLDSDLGGVQFVSISSWSAYRVDMDFDSDGMALPLYKGMPRSDHADTFTQEFNLLGDSGPLSWIVGAYYLNDQQDTLNYVQGPSSPLSISLNRSDQSFQSASIFGDLTYRVTDDFSLYGGLRGIYEKTHFRHENYTGPVAADGAFPPTPPGAGWVCYYDDGDLGNQHDDRTAMTGRFGARYQLNDRSNVYAQFSRGDKSGVFDNASCTPPSKHETMNAYEVGTKNSLAGGALQLNASAYYYDYKDVQIEENVIPFLLFRNAEAEIYGVDLEALVRPSERWHFNLGVNLMSAKYTDFSNADFLDLLVPGYSPDTNLNGHYLNRSPEYTVSVGAQYDQPLDFGTLSFRTDLYASGKYYLRPYNLEDDKQDAYTKIDGSITFISPDERWRARAFIKNATDKAVVFGMISFLAGQEGLYGAPRTYGGEISFSF